MDVAVVAETSINSPVMRKPRELKDSKPVPLNNISIAVLAAGVRLGAVGTGPGTSPDALYRDCVNRLAGPLKVVPEAIKAWVAKGTMGKAETRSTRTLSALSGIQISLLDPGLDEAEPSAK